MIDREQDRRFKNHINKIHGPVDADLFSDLGKMAQVELVAPPNGLGKAMEMT